jgi:predicted RNase H-like HicB family nuclease
MIVFTLRKDDQDDGWVAGCPYFPGCFGQGESRAEALRSVADAVAAVMERADGAPQTPLGVPSAGTP